MKFTSVIFLFISVILIVSGIFAMSYARRAAGDDVLIDGYSYASDGQNSTKNTIDESELTKISLNLSDCDVEIDCSAKESYVELINFKPNTYICSFSGKSISVSDDVSISDYLSFDGSGVKFSGVWQTLLAEFNSRRYDSDAHARTVVIHLENPESLKQINITVSGSNVRLHDYQGAADIKVSATDSTVELTNLSSTVMVLNGSDTDYSVLNVKATKLTSELESGGFTASDITADSVSLDMGELDPTLLNTTTLSFSALIEKGNLTFSTSYDISNFARDLETKEGSIIAGGLNIGSSFKSEKDVEYVGSMSVEITSGNFEVTFGEVIVTPEPDEEDTENSSDKDTENE